MLVEAMARDGALHVVVSDDPVEFRIGPWRDTTGQVLWDRDLLRVRASGPFETFPGWDGISLRPHDSGPGVLSIDAFETPLRTMPVLTHAPEAIDALVLRWSVDPAGADVLVADALVRFARTHGATITWFEDGRRLAERPFVWAEPGHDGDVVLTACLGRIAGDLPPLDTETGDPSETDTGRPDDA